MPNWLGDFCMALPAVGQLARHFDKIILIVPRGLEPLANELDFGVELQVLALASPHRPWSREEVKKLRLAKPDCALLLNNSLRDAWYIFRAGVPRRYGAAFRCRSWLLTKAFRLPKVRKGVLNHVHHFRKYSALAEAIRETIAEKPVIVFGAFKDKDAATELALLEDVAKSFIFVPIHCEGEKSARGCHSSEELGAMAHIGWEAAPNVATAVERARTTGDTVLVGGSLYLAAELLENYADPQTILNI